MKVKVYNSQKDFPISSKSIKAKASALLEKEQVKADEVAIYFVTEKKIAFLHKKFFNSFSSTDCISFPFDGPNVFQGFLGEVFICPKIAVTYAKKHLLDAEEEITLYLIHGILHLLGYDDIKDKNKMRRKERFYLSFLQNLE